MIVTVQTPDAKSGRDVAREVDLMKARRLSQRELAAYGLNKWHWYSKLILVLEDCQFLLSCYGAPALREDYRMYAYESPSPNHIGGEWVGVVQFCDHELVGFLPA